MVALATFKTNVAGAQIVQAIGPLREALQVPNDNGVDLDQRFLLVTDADTGAESLIQSKFPQPQ
jgi:hypothetical protein